MSNQSKRKSSSVKWFHKRKTLITLRWKRGIPRLIIHEKYKRLTKWSLRILTVIGIATSIVSIPTLYLSLLLAITFVVIEQFLERAVFLYTIFYLQPLPDFQWDIGEELIGMGFAFPVPKNASDLNVAGPVFKSESYAHEFFGLLRQWNYGHQEDRDNNICVSLVTVDDGYFSFIYPSLMRRTVKDTFSEIEKMNKFKKYGKEPQEFVIQFTFCRYCPYASNTMFNRFSQEQTEGQPYWLQPFIQNPDGSYKILLSEEPILKFHVKIRTRGELNRNEMEYSYFRNVIDVKPKIE